MSALNAPRNTREIYCGGINYSRKLEIAEGRTVYPGGMIAINANGKVVPASDTAGTIVIGICDAVFNRFAYIRSGTFRLENGKGNEALTRQDIGRYVYALDDQTVGKLGGKNSVVAGVLMNIDENQAIVSIGNHPVNNPYIKIAVSDPAPAEHVAAGTILIVKSGWENGTSIAAAAAGEVYLSNGTSWIKIG